MMLCAELKQLMSRLLTEHICWKKWIRWGKYLEKVEVAGLILTIQTNQSQIMLLWPELAKLTFLKYVLHCQNIWRKHQQEQLQQQLPYFYVNLNRAYQINVFLQFSASANQVYAVLLIVFDKLLCQNLFQLTLGFSIYPEKWLFKNIPDLKLSQCLKELRVTMQFLC